VVKGLAWSQSQTSAIRKASIFQWHSSTIIKSINLLDIAQSLRYILSRSLLACTTIRLVVRALFFPLPISLEYGRG
jgi:hypothetical protein